MDIKKGNEGGGRFSKKAEEDPTQVGRIGFCSSDHGITEHVRKKPCCRCDLYLMAWDGQYPICLCELISKRILLEK